MSLGTRKRIRRDNHHGHGPTGVLELTSPAPTITDLPSVLLCLIWQTVGTLADIAKCRRVCRHFAAVIARGVGLQRLDLGRLCDSPIFQTGGDTSKLDAEDAEQFVDFVVQQSKRVRHVTCCDDADEEDTFMTRDEWSQAWDQMGRLVEGFHFADSLELDYWDSDYRPRDIYHIYDRPYDNRSARYLALWLSAGQGVPLVDLDVSHLEEDGCAVLYKFLAPLGASDGVGRGGSLRRFQLGSIDGYSRKDEDIATDEEEEEYECSLRCGCLTGLYGRLFQEEHLQELTLNCVTMNPGNLGAFWTLCTSLTSFTAHFDLCVNDDEGCPFPTITSVLKARPARLTTVCLYVWNCWNEDLRLELYSANVWMQISDKARPLQELKLGDYSSNGRLEFSRSQVLQLLDENGSGLTKLVVPVSNEGHACAIAGGYTARTLNRGRDLKCRGCGGIRTL